jgi:hypothetical protein
MAAARRRPAGIARQGGITRRAALAAGGLALGGLAVREFVIADPAPGTPAPGAAGDPAPTRFPSAGTTLTLVFEVPVPPA